MRIIQNKILIIDDDNEVRKQYVDLFRKNDFEVLEAKDGVEGLNIVKAEEGIDVIFTGIIMPRMDGFKLISILKEDKMTANIPVVVNSHLGKEEDKEKMRELGAKDFIIRGITSPMEVLKRINQVIKQGEYWLQLDPLKLSGQELIKDLELPEDFKCRNCGTDLSLKAKVDIQGKLAGKITCPNCKMEY